MKYQRMIGGKIGVGGTPISDEKILELFNEHVKFKKMINDAKNCLVCVAIGDPVEVCTNTFDILEGKYSV